MLDLGFIKDIISIKRKLTREHQTLFFSATINKAIKKLAFSQVRKSAIRIQIAPEDPVSINVSHYVMFVEMDDKRFFLERFIKEHQESKIIVFVRTRVRAERVAKAMERAGINTVMIHGARDQGDRADVMKMFREGECRILIATDVSARGIDIPDIDYVINYDLPDKSENYVHRVGRTGRGHNKGEALSFCSKGERDILEDIQKFITKEIAVIKITKDDYSFTVTPSKESETIQEMIDEYENWTKTKRRSKNRKKARK